MPEGEIYYLEYPGSVLLDAVEGGMATYIKHDTPAT